MRLFFSGSDDRSGRIDDSDRPGSTSAPHRPEPPSGGAIEQSIEHDEHDEHDEHEHSEHESGKATTEHNQTTENHGAFVAEYEIQCADIEALHSIEFTYFAGFPNARSLDIVLITDTQQRRQDIDRSNPVLNLIQ